MLNRAAAPNRSTREGWERPSTPDFLRFGTPRHHPGHRWAGRRRDLDCDHDAPSHFPDDTARTEKNTFASELRNSRKRRRRGVGKLNRFGFSPGKPFGAPAKDGDGRKAGAKNARKCAIEHAPFAYLDALLKRPCLLVRSGSTSGRLLVEVEHVHDRNRSGDRYRGALPKRSPLASFLDELRDRGLVENTGG